ncbi:hypothetical protein Nepgr_017869 [Nepenthes gracilis]|uniref:Homeobox domain-containing protein n=1 Tax=Nepenthes gracilis TaxID=150966 RepID=A0AAD3SRA1_NEPGR|nr:hypothetical protein Nepgr_017869 [Nepenthes gracilis]
MTPSPATRWRPTPDQLMILEELYIGGIKTPSASQIQRITSHLSLYGKIECKNVFYWFQNHKAREKQKLRKKLSLGRQVIEQQQQLWFQQQQEVMGLNYQLNHSLYFPEFQKNCAFLQLYNSTNFPTQERTLRSGSSKMMDSTVVGRYNYKAVDDNDGWLIASRSARCATGPPETLQLFPTTSSRCLREEPAA